MVQSRPTQSLTQRLQRYTPVPWTEWPTETELPETDNQPLDNELQFLIPALLRGTLALAWSDRMDWFFGINIGLYYRPPNICIGPDALLSLGVERYRTQGLRQSYVLWSEQVIPQWCLEIVSQAPGKEYGQKFKIYAEMGVLYYVIYNPRYYNRDGHAPFEVYKLVDGAYHLQQGPLVWMSEVGLGIGCALGTHEGLTQEWLYWYDEAGQRYPAPDNVVAWEREQRFTEQQRRQQAEINLSQEQQRRQQLETQLSQAQQDIRKLEERLRQLEEGADDRVDR